MFKRFREITEDVDATKWLVEEMCKVDGSTDFIYAAKEALDLNKEKLVWYVGMIDKYHNHPDMLVPSLTRTRVHFKNIAMSFLHKKDYKMYRVWMKNWIDLLAICRYLDPAWVSDEDL